MFWENTFEVPREMPESIISGACEHNPRTPRDDGSSSHKINNLKKLNHVRSKRSGI